MRNIVLVYPEFPTTYWSYKHIMPFLGKKAVMPPLGLLTIAAMMPEHYNLRLIDMNVSDFGINDLAGIDLVFISAMIVQKSSFEHVVHLCNVCHVPVVAGGPYPTSSNEEITGVDYFILNEAEITLPEFISDYEYGHAKKIYRTDKRPDITRTKPFRLDLINVGDYLNMALQFSRGCPFSCEFCDIIEMFGRVPRTKLPGQFIDELDIIYNSGFRGPVFIVDDNFIGNKISVKILLTHIILWQKSRGFPFAFYTEASINLAQDYELMDLMVDANFDMVFTGIETPDPDTLEKCNKTQNVRMDLYDSIKKIQSKGLEVTGGFIIGFDSDPENIYDLQIDFIQKAGIPTAMIGLLTALPNTQLYRRLQKENRLLGESNGNNTHEFQMNFIPMKPLHSIVEGYKHVIGELYSPKKYFERALVLIRNLSRSGNKSTKIYWTDIRALIVSLLRQTFSRYGFYYLIFLFYALRSNYKRFPQAVAMAVMGYHYFKITHDLLAAEKVVEVPDSTMKHYTRETSIALTEVDIREGN
jgi:radical SAM superfamily enzyme YgiQ (UPF0313 family)